MARDNNNNSRIRLVPKLLVLEMACSLRLVLSPTKPPPVVSSLQSSKATLISARMGRFDRGGTTLENRRILNNNNNKKDDFLDFFLVIKFIYFIT